MKNNNAIETCCSLSIIDTFSHAVIIIVVVRHFILKTADLSSSSTLNMIPLSCNHLQGCSMPLRECPVLSKSCIILLLYQPIPKMHLSSNKSLKRWGQEPNTCGSWEQRLTNYLEPSMTNNTSCAGKQHVHFVMISCDIQPTNSLIYMIYTYQCPMH